VITPFLTKMSVQDWRFPQTVDEYRSQFRGNHASERLSTLRRISSLASGMSNRVRRRLLRPAALIRAEMIVSGLSSINRSTVDTTGWGQRQRPCRRAFLSASVRALPTGSCPLSRAPKMIFRATISFALRKSFSMRFRDQRLPPLTCQGTRPQRLRRSRSIERAGLVATAASFPGSPPAPRGLRPIQIAPSRLDIQVREG
jgi:hypothetical protein